MANKIKAPAFDDIVFEERNKEYGAYKLRKKYSKSVIVSIFVGVFILATGIIVPYLRTKAADTRAQREELEVELRMENLDQPNEPVAPPPPPPPPPQDVAPAAKYQPPVVVDSVKPEDMVQLLTADEAQVVVQNEEVVEVVEILEEIQEAEAEPEIFVVVEEMPMFPGGDLELLKYLNTNTVYPEVAKENNIQGRVIVKFCVTPVGGVSQVTILKGVDPELDAEAIRVVNTLPAFKPGRQGGKAVSVWFQVPITFRLQ